MASWKKVVVSGSGAHLSSVTASNLTVTNGLVRSAAGGEIENAGSVTLSNSTLALGTVNITSGATNSILTGSFSGSFSGSFAGMSQTLAVSGTTGNGTINLSTGVLTIGGTTNQIQTSMAGQTLAIGLTNDVTIPNNLTVTGDLIVNGTTTTINTANLLVEDQFILLASASANQSIDGGIVIQSGSNGSGFGLFYDASEKRWAVSENTNPSGSTTAIPTYFVGFVTSSGVAPSSTAPSYAGTTAYGTMHIDTTTNGGEIWIYA